MLDVVRTNKLQRKKDTQEVVRDYFRFMNSNEKTKVGQHSLTMATKRGVGTKRVKKDNFLSVGSLYSSFKNVFDQDIVSVQNRRFGET